MKIRCSILNTDIVMLVFRTNIALRLKMLAIKQNVLLYHFIDIFNNNTSVTILCYQNNISLHYKKENNTAVLSYTAYSDI